MEDLQKVIGLGKRVFIFLGEAGSGKSEIAVNLALGLADIGKKVRFFDMDQTKPLFRSREAAALLRKNGVVIDDCSQILDAPIIPAGVFNKICEPDSFIILDVGGNATGARNLGQFAEAWNKKVAAYLVINVYRPFSSNPQDMLETIDSIVSAARLERAGVISNPNFGEETTTDDVLAGHKQLEATLRGTTYRVDFLAVPKRLKMETRKLLSGVSLIGIDRHIRACWEEVREGRKEDIYGEDRD